LPSFTAEMGESVEVPYKQLAFFMISSDFNPKCLYIFYLDSRSYEGVVAPSKKLPVYTLSGLKFINSFGILSGADDINPVARGSRVQNDLP